MRVYRLKCPKCNAELLSAAGVPVGQKMTCGHCTNVYEAALPPEEQIPIAAEVAEAPKAKSKREQDGVQGWAHMVLTRMTKGDPDEPKDRFFLVRLGLLIAIAAALGLFLLWRLYYEPSETAGHRPIPDAERADPPPLIRGGLDADEQARYLAVAERLVGRWRAEDVKAIPEGLALSYDFLDTGRATVTAPPRGKKKSSASLGGWHVAAVASDRSQISLTLGDGPATIMDVEVLAGDQELVLYAPNSGAPMKYLRERR
jgi:hypothetical protein